MAPLDYAPLVARILREWPDTVAIYSFGSAGTPRARPDSDVDLAVLTTGVRLPPQRVWEVAQELASIAHRDVDLVDLSVASTVLRAQVVAEGEAIHSGDPAVSGEFEARALADYARLNEERREILADILERGRVSGG